jgi:UDP-N-acetyl-2-amino-2-deoxyglucuronate dehydrogenase
MSAFFSKVGFAIIGYGHIGRKHAENILQNPEATLVGVYDSDPIKRNAVINNSIHCFHDFEEILNNPDVDIICICTPNGFHAQHAMAALNASKHAIIEKPMTLSSDDANQIIDLSQKSNNHVFCVMQNRYSPVAAWLKEVVSSSILGDIYSVSVLCAWNRDERYYKPNHWHGTLSLDGGPLFTQFSHFIDLLYWLLGDIHINKTEFFNHNHKHLTEFEDSGFFTFNSPSFPNLNGLFHYTTSVFNTNFESSISIIAQNGTIKVGGQYMNEIQYCQIQNYQPPILDPAPPPNQYDGYQGSASNHQFVIQNAIDTILHRTSPKTPANEGRDVVKIIESIYKNRIL